MKGQQKDKGIKARDIDRSQAVKDEVVLSFTSLDLVPIEVNNDSFFQYICNSGWIAAIVTRKAFGTVPLGDECEIYHEILLQIYDKLDKITYLYENEGLMPALGYCKAIAEIQAIPSIGVYSKISKTKIPTISMDNDIMKDIDECYNPDVDEIYHLASPTIIYPYSR